MRDPIQQAILKAVRRKPVPATVLRDRHGRSVYAAITALEARGEVTTEWDTSTYPPRKMVSISVSKE